MKQVLPLLILLLIMVAAYLSGATHYLSYESLQTHYEQIQFFVQLHPILSPLLFVSLYILSTTLSLPGAFILSLAGGFLFKMPFAPLYVVIGGTVGATLLFLIANTTIGSYFRQKAGPLLQKFRVGFEKNGWSYLLFLRFIPIFPFWLVNLAPAFVGISLWTYIWTTFVGIIPGAYVFTQAGRGLSAIFERGETFSFDTIFNREIKIALVALALFSLTPILIKKIFKK